MWGHWRCFWEIKLQQASNRTRKMHNLPPDCSGKKGLKCYYSCFRFTVGVLSSFKDKAGDFQYFWSGQKIPLEEQNYQTIMYRVCTQNVIYLISLQQSSSLKQALVCSSTPMNMVTLVPITYVVLLIETQQHVQLKIVCFWFSAVVWTPESPAVLGNCHAF